MNNLNYVQHKLNQMARVYKNEMLSDVCENLAYDLGNPKFESLIFKLSTNETDGIELNDEFNQLYTSLVNYKF